MSDATWIRTHGDRSVWTGGGQLGSQAGLTVGYGGAAAPAGGAIIAGNVGIGTTAPTARLEVVGNIIAAPPTASNHVATRGWVEAAVGVDRRCHVLVSTFNVSCPAGYRTEVSSSGSGCGFGLRYRDDYILGGIGRVSTRISALGTDCHGVHRGDREQHECIIVDGVQYGGARCAILHILEASTVALCCIN